MDLEVLEEDAHKDGDLAVPVKCLVAEETVGVVLVVSPTVQKDGQERMARMK
jgi:hypothetical protein